MKMTMLAMIEAIMKLLGYDQNSIDYMYYLHGATHPTYNARVNAKRQKIVNYNKQKLQDKLMNYFYTLILNETLDNEEIVNPAVILNEAAHQTDEAIKDAINRQIVDDLFCIIK